MSILPCQTRPPHAESEHDFSLTPPGPAACAKPSRVVEWRRPEKFVGSVQARAPQPTELLSPRSLNRSAWSSSCECAGSPPPSPHKPVEMLLLNRQCSRRYVRAVEDKREATVRHANPPTTHPNHCTPRSPHQPGTWLRLRASFPRRAPTPAHTPTPDAVSFRRSRRRDQRSATSMSTTQPARPPRRRDQQEQQETKWGRGYVP